MKLNLCMYNNLMTDGLVKFEEYPEKNLTLVNYKPCVVYNKLWDVDPLLLEARGHVFDSTTGECVVRPFQKIFYIGENNTAVDADREVIVERKVGGFMASVTLYKGWDEPLVSTTHSLDNPSVDIIKSHLKNHFIFNCQDVVCEEPTTFLFKCVDQSNTHTVKELPGLYLLNVRTTSTGDHLKPTQGNGVTLSTFARMWGFRSPERATMSFKDVLVAAEEVQHEGFIVKDKETGGYLCKVKTPHSLTNHVDSVKQLCKEGV